MNRHDIWEDFIVPIGGALVVFCVIMAGIFLLGWVLNAVFGRTPEQEAELNKPRIVYRFDDCEVWIFQNTHYVTRCGNHTVTERHYTENCGKACTKQKVERIEND